MAKSHISKLVCKVVRIKVFWIVVVRINEGIFVSANALEKDVNNSPFRNNNICVGNLVILGADSHMRRYQPVASKSGPLPFDAQKVKIFLNMLTGMTP